VRHLDNRGGQIVVVGREVQNMATAERGTPPHHAGRVDVVQTADVGDGGAPISMLATDVKDAARLSSAGPPVPVVEHQRGVSGLGKPCSVSVQPQFAERGEAVGHHHDGRVLNAIGSIEPCGAGCAVGDKGDVVSNVAAWLSHGVFPGSSILNSIQQKLTSS
jgi:hypothetical protein